MTNNPNPENLFTGKRKPVEVLNKEQTLALLANPGDFLERRDKWEVKSQYLCDFMNDLERTGYVYNTAAMRAFEKAHGLPLFGDNGSVLSLLVYNAQGYRRGDQLVAEGWRPGAELMETAFAAGRKILVKGENILGGEARELLTVRKIDGKLYAMRPHKRKYAVNIAALPCKLEGATHAAVSPEASGFTLLAA